MNNRVFAFVDGVRADITVGGCCRHGFIGMESFLADAVAVAVLMVVGMHLFVRAYIH